MFFEYHGRINADQSGLLYQCKPSGVLGLLQEAATQAAADFHGTGPQVLERYGALWMVTRMWYQLDKPLLWDDRVTVKTWHRADRGAMLYRDFDLLVDGRPVGEAVSVWVLVNAEHHKPLRMSSIPEVAASGGGELCKDKKLLRVKLPGVMSPAGQRTFHYSDCDSNGHVNNIHYADVAADALHMERLIPGRFISSLQISYLRECLAGETIGLHTGAEGETHYVHGLDADGASRFDAALTLSDL